VAVAMAMAVAVAEVPRQEEMVAARWVAVAEVAVAEVPRQEEMVAARALTSALENAVPNRRASAV